MPCSRDSPREQTERLLTGSAIYRSNSWNNSRPTWAHSLLYRVCLCSVWLLGDFRSRFHLSSLRCPATSRSSRSGGVAAPSPFRDAAPPQIDRSAAVGDAIHSIAYSLCRNSELPASLLGAEPFDEHEFDCFHLFSRASVLFAASRPQHRVMAIDPGEHR